MADEIEVTIKKASPNLQDLMIQFKQEIFMDLNCHAVGTIQDFDSANQTAMVTLNYKRTYYERVPNVEKYIKKFVDYPLLASCPVISLQGGAAGLTLPIKKGDTCLILFNDRSLDNWFSTGDILPLDSIRMHNISDGIILVGLRHDNNPLTNYDTQRASLYNGETRVAVSDTKILAENSTTTLNTLIGTLIDTIKALTAGGNAIDPAGQTALDAVKTQFGGLLE